MTSSFCQDSMLVDIDDLTRRLKEMAEKSKKPGPLKETARNAKKTPLKQFNDWLSRKWNSNSLGSRMKNDGTVYVEGRRQCDDTYYLSI